MHDTYASHYHACSPSFIHNHILEGIKHVAMLARFFLDVVSPSNHPLRGGGRGTDVI